jgi:predicted cupin superfamily sugar epimerase
MPVAGQKSKRGFSPGLAQLVHVQCYSRHSSINPVAGANRMDIETLKKTLGLVPLPHEGGFYAESYRSSETLPQEHLSHHYTGERPLATAIYFLLTPDSFSALHRLASDEIWHFYLGDPVEMLQLREPATGRIVMLGTDFNRGMRPQVVVPRGTWQGARLLPGGTFALLGATVSPGFDFQDFELAQRELLLAAFPEFAELATALTR